MSSIKFFFVFAFLVALSAGEAVKEKRETTEETAQEPSQLDKVQQQLMTAFDSFKKSMEDLASKFNTEDIAQGVQSITSKIEGFAKQAAEQFASSASGTTTEQKAPESAPVPEAAPAP